ncbi:MAG: aldo/keto reductase [Litorimonas sp.]
MDRISLSPDLSVSRIVYGLMGLTDGPEAGISHAQARIEACLAQGITTLDQADIYGGYTSEAALGALFRAAPALREQVEIVTKCGIVAPVGRHAGARVKHYDTSATHIRHSVEHSLRLMGVERIDLLLIHRPDPFMDAVETGAALDALVASGDVRAVGVSNFRPHDMALLGASMDTPLVTNQIELSLLARDAFTNGDLAYLQRRGLPPMAWSPLGGGALFGPDHPALRTRLEEIAADTGTDASAVAVAWLLAHPARILPVMGTNRLQRIQRLGDALRVPMDRERWFELYTLARGQEVP